MKKNFIGLLCIAFFCAIPHVTASDESTEFPLIMRLRQDFPTEGINGEVTELKALGRTTPPFVVVTFAANIPFAFHMAETSEPGQLGFGDVRVFQSIDSLPMMFEWETPRGNSEFCNGKTFRRRFYLTSQHEPNVVRTALNRENFPYEPFMLPNAVIVFLRDERAILISPSLYNPLEVVPQQRMPNPIAHTSTFSLLTSVTPMYQSARIGNPMMHVTSLHFACTGIGGLSYSRTDGLKIFGNHLRTQELSYDAYRDVPPVSSGATYPIRGCNIIRLNGDKPIVLDEVENLKIVFDGSLDLTLSPWKQTTVTVQRAGESLVLLYFLADVY
ncbi:MAG: hypothetical protein LBB34_00815 [Holosporales bacterium]|jgi:hypothetical protein|nr:hypothetical protein [Holosporales bacterium]